MAENKTQVNNASVEEFVNAIPDEQRRKDSLVLLEWMTRVTGLTPKMWGDAIVGFGLYHYKYATGREGDTPLVGFSPRKQNMTVYLWYGFEANREWMERLGKYKVGKACLYFNKLKDIDLSVLEKLVEYTIRHRGDQPA
jgi:hypothetical protein